MSVSSHYRIIIIIEVLGKISAPVLSLRCDSEATVVGQLLVTYEGGVVVSMVNKCAVMRRLSLSRSIGLSLF